MTQITCRRINQETVAISIIPGARASAAYKEKLRAFHAETTDVYREDFARIFQEAKQNDLKLSYYIVKNRSADDDLLSLQDRNDAEKMFFKPEP
ncbi:hypothetical protein VTK26DRAFT_8202 [Humicola hyalothermophila]